MRGCCTSLKSSSRLRAKILLNVNSANIKYKKLSTNMFILFLTRKPFLFLIRKQSMTTNALNALNKSSPKPHFLLSIIAYS